MFLLSSRDPERVARYRDVATWRGESLGADAYELWDKMPDYLPNKSAKVKTQKELEAYEAANLGTMRVLMEARGLGERYREIVAAQIEHDWIRQEKAKRAQNNVLIMGCAGMGAILLMMMGTPTLVSEDEALREVAGGAAVRVEARSVESIAEGLRRLLSDEGLRERLSVEGPKQVAGFTWEAAARTVLGVYESVRTMDDGRRTTDDGL